VREILVELAGIYMLLSPDGMCPLTLGQFLALGKTSRDRARGYPASSYPALRRRLAELEVQQVAADDARRASLDSDDVMIDNIRLCASDHDALLRTWFTGRGCSRARPQAGPARDEQPPHDAATHRSPDGEKQQDARHAPDPAGILQHVFQQLAPASAKGVKGDQSSTPSRPRRGEPMCRWVVLPVVTCEIYVDGIFFLDPRSRR
jgi:hypothetical protein